jgi:hypothetical protein
VIALWLRIGVIIDPFAVVTDLFFEIVMPVWAETKCIADECANEGAGCSLFEREVSGG